MSTRRGFDEQVAQQPVLGCRQVDELAGSAHLMGVVVHLEVRELEQFAGGPPLPDAAKDGLGAGDELGHAERLGDVVVAADREAPDLVLGGVAGGEEQHGDVAPVSAEALGDVEAVDVGQHHVEHDEVGTERVDLLERPVPAGGGLDVEALVAKRHRDELGDGLLVVDDEDTRGRFSCCHLDIVADKAGSLLRVRGACGHRWASATNIRSIRSLSWICGRVRRAPLPFELQLSRRRLLPRGARRGGRPARARSAGAHRPRRPLRRGALCRGGKRSGRADRLRCRAHPWPPGGRVSRAIVAPSGAVAYRPRRGPGLRIRPGPTWSSSPEIRRATPASPVPSARAISPVARRVVLATTSTGWPSSQEATSSS